MTPLSTRNVRLEEKSIEEKSYFSDKEVVTLKDKCYMGVLLLLVVLFGLNIYQTIINASMIEIIF